MADIPLEPDHPSRAPLAAVADGLAELKDVPALLLWGARDPVFTERYLADLTDRLPQADVQRYARAGHLVTEDVPGDGRADLALAGRPTARSRRRPLRQAPSASRRGRPSRTGPATAPPPSWRCAAGSRTGCPSPGSRTGSPRPPPGCRTRAYARATGSPCWSRPALDLTVAVYACWRVGAVIVVADAGLGLRGLFAALRGAGPDHVIGTDARWPRPDSAG